MASQQALLYEFGREVAGDEHHNTMKLGVDHDSKIQTCSTRTTT